MTRAIAFHLPQFHPIPQNDEWWGKGFTEWTNTAKAKPLFEGHYQPHVPADLGFYDLRLPEARQDQADLAKKYGIEGFCYYHYWFGHGQRILERPFEEILASGEPDFPFCLCWANHSWTGVWHGVPDRLLIAQTYPGPADNEAHFNSLLPAFQDPRYIKVDGNPVFLVFDPYGLPDARAFAAQWHEMALKAGLPGLHLLAIRHNGQNWNPHDGGFDGAIDMRIPFFSKEWSEGTRETLILDHRQVTAHEVAEPEPGITTYPCIGPSWDNTPRLGRRGIIYVNSHPDLFRETVRRAVGVLAQRPAENQLMFLKAWNEWAEGNHLEPDLKFGHGWLEALRQGMACLTS
ncbi:MAG: glycoside hydrolase family 99-like domain-containing protein [Acidocella sp.]|nr:glycoside hydrolase family 99-like domain-containing protein [Acidocella sp.]